MEFDDGAPNKKVFKKRTNTLRHCWSCNVSLEKTCFYYVQKGEDGKYHIVDSPTQGYYLLILPYTLDGYSLNKHKAWEQIDEHDLYARTQSDAQNLRELWEADGDNIKRVQPKGTPAGRLAKKAVRQERAKQAQGSRKNHHKGVKTTKNHSGEENDTQDEETDESSDSEEEVKILQFGRQSHALFKTKAICKDCNASKYWRRFGDDTINRAKKKQDLMEGQ